MIQLMTRGACLALVMGVLTSVAEAQTDGDNTTVFMRAKLARAQGIIESLSLADFDSLRNHAAQLKTLSLDSGWKVLQTVEYAWYSAEFRRTTDQLVEAADEENLDAAVLAYFRLTQSCVGCHRHVCDEQSP